MYATTNKKEIVPTLVIGIGGTGLETLLRVRRLITESYQSLDNLPIVGFLHIDTDPGYKPSNPLMMGPPLENQETYYSTVSVDEVGKIVKDPTGWDWYHEWLPPELLNKPGLLASQEGAGQIRACGRFSFFFNRNEIGQACQRIKNEVRKGEHIPFMLQHYELTVMPKLNVFVACSIAGGTGSGMLIDFGYSLLEWFRGDDVSVTAIICTPDAFGGVSATNPIQRNGYAALMELNYFSDQSTQFSVRYGANEGTRIETSQPPYNYIYLLGKTNENGVNLSLDQVREVMAQNIFLDLVSDFSPYKRSIRDNIKRQAAGQNDQPPGGQSYPRNFMSFGLATIEIPIHHIRTSLASRLAADLLQWWQNSSIEPPTEPQTFVDEQLRQISLLRNELCRSILRAKDKSYPYQAVVEKWLSQLRQDIITNEQLQCTQQGIIGIFSKETGKVATFIDQYLIPKVNDYKTHFDDSSPDKRIHGDFLRVMYDNQNLIRQEAESALKEQIYDDLVNRNLGPKFVQLKLDLIKRSFDTDIERMVREAGKTWLVIEQEAQKQYEASLSQMKQFQSQWGLLKKSEMNKECDNVLTYLGQALNAFLERKSRVLAAEVLRQMKNFILQLEQQFNRWQTRIEQSKVEFNKQHQDATNQADGLEIVGIKLFKRQEINELYEDFLAKLISGDGFNIKVASQQGLDFLCQKLTENILERSSYLWVDNRPSEATFRLLDIEKIKDIQYDDFEKIIYQQTISEIKRAGQNTKLVTNMDACTRFMQEYPQNNDQDNKIRELFNQSKPLVRLDQVIPQNSGFNYINFAKAGLIDGENTQEPAAQKQVAILGKYFTDAQAIAPITKTERHKILAIHEVGGFSLRCIEGNDAMRKSYQMWLGARINAERQKLKGINADLPPSVHLQKDLIFWDLVPPDPEVEKIVLICRALKILREEENKNTKQSVIRYLINVNEKEETVTLAANWEAAVQVLQIPDCANDKKELQRQLDESLDKAEEQGQKQEIQERLDYYLEQRISDFRKDGGEDNPRYLRERNIITEFSIKHKLKASIGQASSVNSPLQPEINKQDLDLQAKYREYEQYLRDLSNIKMPKAAFIMSAEDKASDLGLDKQQAENIRNNFIK